ncbi:brachyurin-like [Neocloeon triangulifer]|uniref:brachyurin-like n=1 Tax=Neocloeon triangulifer TaxID=2078957 RepID=UPI00286F5C74|nr:brachyurin-like [Neocloeon triangulifer]
MPVLLKSCFLIVLSLFVLKISALTFKRNIRPKISGAKKFVLTASQNRAINTPKLDFKPTGKEPQTGAIEKQIIGGRKAQQKKFPWQIHLNADDSWVCGGSIISKNWVVTAAHCVDGGTSFVISAGGIDITSNETGEIVQTSTEAIVHEAYDATNITNDIGLIKLPNPYTLSTNIFFIKLPSMAEASKTFVNALLTVSGYGMTRNTGPASNYLSFIDVKVISNTACSNSFGAPIPSTNICTAKYDFKQICSGDSGGPLVQKRADGHVLIGIVSFSGDICTESPAGFTRVTSFLGWISSQTNIKVNEN